MGNQALFLIFTYCISYSTSIYTQLSNLNNYELYPENQHPCNRPCQMTTHPMTCHYVFKVAWYVTMGRACFDCPNNITDCSRPHCIPGDGNSRPVLVVNRQMPGPRIELCLGDEIIVDVVNTLPNEETSIHWHGQHQVETPYMDGVPHLSQCPITSGSTFTYNFRATQIGTHYWHSHSGLQRGDGCFGPLIVRGPKETNPHFDLYDYDLSLHVITVMDWVHSTSLTKYMYHHNPNEDNKADSILVNGLGYFDLYNHTNNITPATFTVQLGYKYRFRYINNGFLNCPIEMSVDNHTLTVISGDGIDFKPIEVNSLVSYAGERFDFIIDANQEIDNYWIRFRGLLDCDERFRSVHQVAILHYEDADEDTYPAGDPDYESAHQDGLQLNPLNKGANSSLAISILDALVPYDESLKEIPDHQFYIAYDFYYINNPKFYATGLYEIVKGNSSVSRLTPQLNFISLKYPDFPLLPGRDLITPDMFCNISTVKNCDKKYCTCTHVLQAKLNSVVELILVDKGFVYEANHPFHLHGNAFRVVAMERVGNHTTVDEVKALDKAGLIKRKLYAAPMKDTITVPDGGYTILRFQAKNPGYWLFHCHLDFHSEMGMALIFKVGEDSDLPPVPSGFPVCGSWKHHNHPDYSMTINKCNTTIEISNMPFYKKFWYEVFPEIDCVTATAPENRINLAVTFLVTSFVTLKTIV